MFFVSRSGAAADASLLGCYAVCNLYLETFRKNPNPTIISKYLSAWSAEQPSKTCTLATVSTLE